MHTPLSIGDKIIDLVTANPGKYTRESIVAKIRGEEPKSVNMSLGRLLGKGSKKVKEINGFLFPGDVMTASDVPQLVSQAKEIPSRYFEYGPKFSERISLPKIKRSLKMRAIIEVRMEEPTCYRFGVSDLLQADAIRFIPSFGIALHAQIGDFEPNPHAEIMKGKYLAIVVPDPQNPKDTIVKYYEAPKSQQFVLSWIAGDASDDESDDD